MDHVHHLAWLQQGIMEDPLTDKNSQTYTSNLLQND